MSRSRKSKSKSKTRTEDSGGGCACSAPPLFAFIRRLRETPSDEKTEDQDDDEAVGEAGNEVNADTQVGMRILLINEIQASVATVKYDAVFPLAMEKRKKKWYNVRHESNQKVHFGS